MYPKRGDVYWVSLDPTIGTEINKIRPAVIVSNDTGNEVSAQIIAAPIASSLSKIYPFQVKVESKNLTGKILLNQIRNLDKIRLKSKITSLSKELMLEVDKALKVVLALS